jgi:serine/threonine protein kinase
MMGTDTGTVQPDTETVEPVEPETETVEPVEPETVEPVEPETETVDSDLGFLSSEYGLVGCNEPVGEGSFGKVYRLTRGSGEDLAVKIGKVKLEESNTMATLVHPHIVQLIDIILLPSGRTALLMTYIPGGDLFDAIITRLIDREHIQSIMQQLIAAIYYMHEAGVMHLDIKPENVMLTDKGDVVLVDFGLAKTFTSKTIPIIFDGGSPKFVAPETPRMTPKSDMWSLGVLLYVMIFEGFPFINCMFVTECTMTEHLHDRIAPADANPDMVDLLNRLMCLNEDQRLDSKGAMKHAWIFKDSPPQTTTNLPPSGACAHGHTDKRHKGTLSAAARKRVITIA